MSGLKRTDFIIISVLILLALISYIIFYIYGKNVSDATLAKILINGRHIKTISLDKDKIFIIDELTNIKFEIKDKKIRFLESNCPDKICVNTGFIGIVGETAVCLPNATSIQIISSDKNTDGYDAVT